MSFRRSGGCRSGAPVLARAAHGDAARAQGRRPVRRRARRPDQGAVDSQHQSGGEHAARRARARGARRLSVRRRSAIAGRPTRPASPMSCCRRRRGARRTARSPIRNDAFRGSARSVRRRAKPSPIGGCWPRWRGAWAGRAEFAYRSAADIFREHAALSAFENEGGRRIFDIGALADLSDEDYDQLPPLHWPLPRGGAATGTKRLFGDGKGFATPMAARASCRRRTGRRPCRRRITGRLFSTPAAFAISGTP